MANIGPGPMPGGMPPGVPPPAGPPPGLGGPPPMGPAMGPPPGLGGPPLGAPSSDSPFVDVSQSLPTEYQMLDACSRLLKKAVNTGAFYQQPDVLQMVRDMIATLDRTVIRYSNQDGLDISGSPVGDDAKIVGADDEEDDD